MTDGYDKLRGGYYTPDIISNFIARWALRSKDDTVLEPSCGDGGFLESIQLQMKKMACTRRQIAQQVTGIELDSNEAEKAGKYGATIETNDFFAYYQNNIYKKTSFDVIVGNPPFIRYQNFKEEHRASAFELMQKYGFHPNRLTNAWIPFLLLSCCALNESGRIGMVIPAELFQVNYAAEARMFLSDFFQRLTLITFRQLVFDGIQQEVVLLLGERKSENSGIKVVELDGIGDLATEDIRFLDGFETKELDHSSEKWVKYYLSNPELDLLNRLNANPQITGTQKLFETNVGLVSGENDFFILTQKQVDEFSIQDAVKPIISKAEQVKGIRLSSSEPKRLAGIGKRVFLFAPEDKDVEELDCSVQTYIHYGEAKGFQKNYKCRIRKRWYIVPQPWKPDGFLVRQVHLYPRLIVNKSDAHVTDTLHKVRFLQGVKPEKVAAAFLNSYTFALGETMGRSYGGGVLTFEPGEIRELRIPMIHADKLDEDKIDRWVREGKIEQVLAYTDQILLRDGLGLSDCEISILRGIWIKMRDRRLNRKRNSSVHN